MDPRLLDYYSRELFYMRELAAEFAGSHKKIAKRLGMQAGEIADPCVERLIQASSFISAHTQMKIDAAFPRFTQRLLEVTYPNYVSPIPSMSVARLFPGDDEGDLLEGFRVPRGADFISPVQHGEKIAMRIPQQPGCDALAAGDR